MTQIDPKRPASFLQSSRSEKPNFREFELYEAVVSGLTLPGTTGLSGLNKWTCLTAGNTSDIGRPPLIAIGLFAAKTTVRPANQICLL